MTVNEFKRIIVVVLDSVGIGEAPDAAKFGDIGAHTLGHIAKHVNGLSMPNLGKLGLGNIEKIQGIKREENLQAYYTKMEQASNGKDTMTGHWEIMGLHINDPFKTFSNGFPSELIKQLEERTGRKVIGNKPASGTAIIEELGDEHIRTGAIIVYTSADSVLQIAAHEEIVPLEELYAICKIARELTLNEEFMVGRVIARPFIGEQDAYIRTANRHDYALKPFGRTVMDELKDANYDVIALGKIHDIFDGEGITKSVRTINNDDGITKLIKEMDQPSHGLIFLNLVDFDAVFGHRRDPVGYANALEDFDKRLPNILDNLKKEDLIIFTADHGNDPTFHGTDHTRENVPLLIYHKNIKKGGELPIRKTFADIGATIADNFSLPPPLNGKSFLKEID